MAKFADRMEKIAGGVVEGYKKIENGVVAGYKKVEDAFVSEIQKDIASNNVKGCRISLFLTHLNETNGCVIMKDEAVRYEEFMKRPLISDAFDGVYISASEYSEDTIPVV